MATTSLDEGPLTHTVIPDQIRLVALITKPVTILSLDGPLTSRSIPACREAVDALTGLRVRRLRLDLPRTRTDRDTLPVLILMRRYAYRRGIRLTLGNAPGALVRALAHTHLDPVDDTPPTSPRQARPLAGGTGTAGPGSTATAARTSSRNRHGKPSAPAPSTTLPSRREATGN